MCGITDLGGTGQGGKKVRHRRDKKRNIVGVPERWKRGKILTRWSRNKYLQFCWDGAAWLVGERGYKSDNEAVYGPSKNTR